MSVKKAFDKAGNRAYDVSTAFEIDLGPWFEVRAFASPILKREITFIVRCHEKDGGALENLVTAPHMEVKQTNAPKQIVTLTAFQPSVYRGIYVVDQNYPGDAVILLTGRDVQGNQTSRLINFSVAEIIAADRFVATFGSLTMDLPEKALSSDECLVLLPSDFTEPHRECPGNECCSSI